VVYRRFALQNADLFAFGPFSRGSSSRRRPLRDVESEIRVFLVRVSKPFTARFLSQAGESSAASESEVIRQDAASRGGGAIFWG